MHAHMYTHINTYTQKWTRTQAIGGRDLWHKRRHLCVWGHCAVGCDSTHPPTQQRCVRNTPEMLPVCFWLGGLAGHSAGSEVLVHWLISDWPPALRSFVGHPNLPFNQALHTHFSHLIVKQMMCRPCKPHFVGEEIGLVIGSRIVVSEGHRLMVPFPVLIL